jgi:hypothetical protein
MNTIDKFNKKYLSFIYLNVNLLIKSLIVNNVEYDIEHLLNNENIKIQSICQTPDTLCYDNHKQYKLYEKLKNYSKKYSIYLETIHNRDLIRILNEYSPNLIKESYLLRFQHMNISI